MIIDQLPLLQGNPIDDDEFPVERGTTTYKTKLQAFAAAVLGKLVKDAAPTEDSTNPVESGGVYNALQTVSAEIATKQDQITANGILKGNGTAVSAANKGTDYGALAFTVTLTAAGWSDNAQTVSNANFVASGYGYIVSPVSGSFSDYASAQIYADAVTVTGQMTFHCTTPPTNDLNVNILRVVSA